MKKFGFLWLMIVALLVGCQPQPEPPDITVPQVVVEPEPVIAPEVVVEPTEPDSLKDFIIQEEPAILPVEQGEIPSETPMLELEPEMISAEPEMASAEPESQMNVTLLDADNMAALPYFKVVEGRLPDQDDTVLQTFGDLRIADTSPYNSKIFANLDKGNCFTMALTNNSDVDCPVFFSLGRDGTTVVVRAGETRIHTVEFDQNAPLESYDITFDLEWAGLNDDVDISVYLVQFQG